MNRAQLLAELAAGRCRWPPDQPYPPEHQPYPPEH
jgi:hypothetical protein